MPPWTIPACRQGWLKRLQLLSAACEVLSVTVQMGVNIGHSGIYLRDKVPQNRLKVFALGLNAMTTYGGNILLHLVWHACNASIVL